MRSGWTAGVVAGLVFWCLAPASAEAQLARLETEDLRLVYFSPSLDYLTPHAARCLVNSLAFQKRIYGFDPPEKVTVLLKDFSDHGNAGAGAIPRDALLFDVAPLDSSFETVVSGERMYLMANHELVHIVTQDKPTAADRRWRKFFHGKVMPLSEHPETVLYLYLTAPRLAAPRWYSEGIAVFSETWMAGGVGRAQGSYDEMVFRSKVLDGSRFYDPLGLISEGVSVDFQVMVNAYLYGTRFMTYLAYTYGPEALTRWVARSEGSRRYWASEFERVFGAPLDEVWQAWIDSERVFQQANLDLIREFPVTPYEDISPRALGSVSRAYYDAETGEIYAAFNYPGVVAHIGAISMTDGSVRRIRDVKGPSIYSVTSVAYDPERKQIYYATDNGAFRDLRVVDPATRRSRMLLKDARIGELVFNRADRSLWGVRHLNGIATLVRIPEPYDEWQQIRSWPYGEVLLDLDLSRDGELASMTVGEISGHHEVRVYRTSELLDGDVAQGDLETVAEVDFGTTIPMQFVFSEDGRYIYGSSYYTGAANIFRYDIAAGELEALTNTETGLFRPIPLADGRVIAFRYTGDGFVATTIAPEPLEDVNAIKFFGTSVIRKYPQLAEWQVDSPATVDLEQEVVAEGDYGSYRSMNLESVYPVVEGYKSSAAYGFRANFSDWLGLNRANMVMTYSPDEELASDERLHVELEFERYNFRARARWNDADFYDLFGPTKRSRKGYSLGVTWNKYLISDRPRQLMLTLDGVYFGDLETLPQYQNVAATFDRLFWTRATLAYENLRGSLAKVDDEKGVRWQLVGENNYVDDRSNPLIHADLDLGVALPARHASLWLRSSVGRGLGDLDNEFSSFFFGGFGNNWVDQGEIKRYREYYAFPGLELNEVGGRSYAKSLLDLNLPPVRFSNVGGQSLYLTWMRASLFGGALLLDPDEQDRDRTFYDLGAQIDFRLKLINNLDLTLSVGYAEAREDGGESSGEWMASLKIF